MKIPIFSGNEDKDEIGPREWLKMIRKNFKTPSLVGIYFNGDVAKWWYILD